ncbi:hypothetical protein FRB94_005991 [Tulasnella sp. JGI-2019a]|nr:hypothetical protein FRB93_000372 [Tulasnella sp. JGI-2019a]KAG8999688.1 hypothetical protein FRB94_005991 [Tulasnella sp. JGI-2019a]
MAQSQQVMVLMNNTRVTYGLAGQPTDLAGITNGGGPAAFLGECGSFVGLYAANSAATLLFTGTSVTINVLGDQARGGPYDVYLDGVLNQQGDNSGAGNPFSSLCNSIPVTISNLPSAVHNITVVNFNGGLQELIVQSFSYVGSPIIPTTGVSTGSTSVPAASGSTTDPATSTATHHSIGPIIGVIVAAIIVVAAIVVASFFTLRRRRRNRLRRNRVPVLDDYTPLNPFDADDSQYASAPHQMTAINSRPPNRHHQNLIPYNPDGPTLHIQDSHSDGGSVSTHSVGPQSVAGHSSQSTHQPPSPSPLPSMVMIPPREKYNPKAPLESTTSSTPQSQSQIQLEVIQAMLARGIPNEEITSMIRMMTASASGGPSTGGSQSQSNGQGLTPHLPEGTPPSYDYKG